MKGKSEPRAKRARAKRSRRVLMQLSLRKSKLNKKRRKQSDSNLKSSNEMKRRLSNGKRRRDWTSFHLKRLLRKRLSRKKLTIKRISKLRVNGFLKLNSKGNNSLKCVGSSLLTPGLFLTPQLTLPKKAMRRKEV